MDLFIGGITLVIVIIVILSPFLTRKGFVVRSNNDQELDPAITEADLRDLRAVLELDYALGNMSELDYQSQLSEYDARIQSIVTSTQDLSE
ncbi:MAG: hypothetical protein ACJ0KI_06595 [Dehalococcoidia bacterium]|tara:strand:- start:3358 stop:3630 length:273 start_codon:yes stop_codon:yes gene_type:complete